MFLSSPGVAGHVRPCELRDDAPTPNACRCSSAEERRSHTAMVGCSIQPIGTNRQPCGSSVARTPDCGSGDGGSTPSPGTNSAQPTGAKPSPAQSAGSPNRDRGFKFRPGNRPEPGARRCVGSKSELRAVSSAWIEYNVVQFLLVDNPARLHGPPFAGSG